MKLIMFGPPGSGKGTHGDLLSKTLHIPKISMGDLVRAEVASGSLLGKKIQPVMASGGLVDDQTIIELLRKKFSATTQGFILDGFPRTLAQAEALETITTIDAVIALDIPDAEVLRRLGGRWTCRTCAKIYHDTDLPPHKKGVCDSCGGALYQREDDKEETIKRRLAVYKKETQPLLSFYEKKGILKTISILPNSSVDENFKNILRTANGVTV